MLMFPIIIVALDHETSLATSISQSVIVFKTYDMSWQRQEQLKTSIYTE